MEPLPIALKCRKWTRFGLRTIMVVTVIVAIPLAWKFNRVRAQRRAAESLRSAGVDVLYDFEESASAAGVSAVPPVSVMWSNLFGIDCFADVKAVCFLNSLAGPAHLRGDTPAFPEHVYDDIQDLPEVSRVSLSPATDAMLDSLSKARSLETVSIAGDFTDAGVVRLSALRRLKYLSIMSPHMSAAGLCELRYCADLRHLIVNGPEMSEQDLTELRDALPQCQVWYGPRPLLRASAASVEQ